jgi:formylglycine-generating enzyme required for sulfatase activity
MTLKFKNRIFYVAIGVVLFTNLSNIFGQSDKIEFVEIPKGSFIMGADLDPSFIIADKSKAWRSIFIQDEFPVRNVRISKDFAISKYEITNIQYEQFDPNHKQLRGNFMEISTKDNEAVVNVSWEEAMRFANWLSKNDLNFDYRLPTEAEWEYVARAGKRTAFNDGNEVDIYENNPFTRDQMEKMNYQWPYPFTWSNGCRGWVTWKTNDCIGIDDVYPSKTQIKKVDLTVGQSGPNIFGVYDLHGGVEEWVMDWYGFYNKKEIKDPVGPITGDFKVSRGGSHNNHVQFARSANRMSSAINDRHYFLGFRVVRVPKYQKLSSNYIKQPKRNWAVDVSQQKYKWGQDTEKPVFSMVSLFDLVPKLDDGSHYGSDAQLRQFGFDPQKNEPLLTGPLYTHNHSATVAWCANGDILASWFSGESETGTDLTLVASRAKRKNDGTFQWTYPSDFLKAADRNMHGSNIITDKNGVLHQMASIGISGRWDKLALGYRSSSDNGASWSPVRMVLELDHALNDGCSMQGNMFEASNGDLVFVVDDEGDEISNTGSLVVSSDGGKTWKRRGHSSTTGEIQRIAGLHSAVVEIADLNGDNKTDLLALARDNGAYYGGKVPQSTSVDGGKTWTREPSVFPSIKGEQRLCLLRLKYSKELTKFSGRKPILFVGFSNSGFQAKDATGKIDNIEGLFVALSFDEGKTWPTEYRRVVSDITGSEIKEIEVAPWQKKNKISKVKGIGIGYMSVTQSPDGMIYLSDGKLVYSFNLAWIIEGSKN